MTFQNDLENRPEHFPRITSRGCTRHTETALVRNGFEYLFDPSDSEDAIEIEAKIGEHVWQRFEMVSDRKQKCFNVVLSSLVDEIDRGTIFQLRMYEAVTGDHKCIRSETRVGKKALKVKARIKREATESENERLSVLTWENVEKWMQKMREDGKRVDECIPVSRSFFDAIKKASQSEDVSEKPAGNEPPATPFTVDRTSSILGAIEKQTRGGNLK